MAKYFVVDNSYRPLLESLTPRQLKDYLRARLIDPQSGSPEETLLRSTFPPFYRMFRQEKHLFNMLHDAAVNLFAHNLRDQILDGNALAMFEYEVQRIAQISRFLESEEVERYWPRKMNEKKLLVCLLSVMDASKDGFSEEGSALNNSNAQVESAMETTLDEVIGVDNEFSNWVRGELGQAPEGATISEQVSSFQDMVLEKKYYQGQQVEAQKLVYEYMVDYWERHQNQFVRGSAETLSNLATIIQANPQLARMADTLYKKALQVNPNHHRVPLLYGEYLIELLLGDQANVLFEGGYYADRERLYEQIQRLYERCHETMEGEALLRADGIKLGLEVSRKPIDEKNGIEYLAWVRDRALELLVDQHAPLFIQAAKEADMGLATRLDNMLSDIMGKAGLTITYKGQVLIVVSQLLTLCGLNSWTVDVHIEDDYVGEDSSSGRWYKIGLGISRYLLVAPELLDRHPEHIAMIWTQSAQAILYGDKTQARQRVALAFLAAQIYGGLTQTWQQRLVKVWQEVAEPEDTNDIEQLESILSIEQRQLVYDLKLSRSNIQYVQPIVDVVFGDSFALLDMGHKDKISRLGEVDGKDGWSVEDIQNLSDRAEGLSREYCSSEK